MDKEDFDEDIYEETTSKVVYKRKSSLSHSKEDEEVEVSDRGRVAQEEEEWKLGTDRRAEDTDDAWVSFKETKIKPKRFRISDEIRLEKGVRGSNEDLTYTDKAVAGTLRESGSESDIVITSEKVKEEVEDWSERAKKTAEYKFPRARRADATKARFLKENAARDADYKILKKWEVDYTNKNFVRSRCNKPRGLHRYVLGKPFDWEIDYDNNYFLRSKISAPKGLHRLRKEIKRKRVPDNDILADSTGWEFEYGPEFNQLEGDVPFYPEERVIGRGGYRFYGVKRNDSDTDRKIKEKRTEIKGLFEDELKSGREFLQDEVPHTLNQKERIIGRGGYRFIDVDRNIHDIRPKDAPGVDYRASRATVDVDFDEEEEIIPKGKPFKRTLLKKEFKLLKPKSIEKFTHGTVLSFVPGAGSKFFYEGKSTRPSILEIKKHPSIRDVFQSGKQTRGREKRMSGISDSDFTAQRIWDERIEQRRLKEHKRTRDEKDFNRRGSWGRFSPESSPPRRYPLKDITEEKFDYGERKFGKDRIYTKPKESYYSGYSTDTSGRHKFPPEIQNRINEMRNTMTRGKTTHDQAIRKKPLRSHFSEESDEESDIDWKSHDGHPYDHGKSITEGYEKFVNERGSEIWVKTREKYSEFHHKKRS